MRRRMWLRAQLRLPVITSPSASGRTRSHETSDQAEIKSNAFRDTGFGRRFFVAFRKEKRRALDAATGNLPSSTVRPRPVAGCDMREVHIPDIMGSFMSPGMATRMQLPVRSCALHAAISMVIALGFAGHDTATGQEPIPLADALGPDMDRDAAVVTEDPRSWSALAVQEARRGRRPSAAAAWDRIADPAERYQLIETLARGRESAGTPGGGSLADFSPLISLITSTVQPDTWEDNGGQGAIQGFPAGILVDAKGFLSRPDREPWTALRESGARAVGIPTTRAVTTKGVRLRMVSLPRLERAALRRVLAGQPLSRQMLRLAGLQRVRYVLLFPKTRDLVLAGPAADDGPSLSLDALIAVLHSQLQGNGKFGCSIEPRPANLAAAAEFATQSSGRAISRGRRERFAEELRQALGLQDIAVHGVDPRSHAAHIMVAADYHMKLIGLGIEPGIPEVPAYFDQLELGPDGRLPPLDLLRWWFTMDYDAIHHNEDHTYFEMQGRGARVLCENEFLAEQGQRIHTGIANPQNQEFAASFSRHLPQLALQYPMYRQLQGLFDLAMATALIHREEMAERVEWKPTLLLLSPTPWSMDGPVAKEVASVARCRELNRATFITGVSGGVAVDPRSQFERMSSAHLSECLQVRQVTRPVQSYEAAPRWYWDVAAPSR